eukprot:SAG22_NODE_1926_length_3298_cov_2.512660_1_plen_121_part_00
MKKRQEEKAAAAAAAAAAADPNPGFAQSYVDQKLKEQGERHAREMSKLDEKLKAQADRHAREIQKMEEQHKAAIGERSARIKKAEEACARLRARNDLIKKDKTDLEDKIKMIADLAAPTL